MNVHPSVPGGERYETNVTVPFADLTQDEWFVVVAKGTDGTSVPMFPIYGGNLDIAGNLTLANLTTVTPSESGCGRSAFTNALYVDVDGNGVYDAPGVQLAP